MSSNIFFVVLLIQFVVQLVLYYQVRFVIFNIGLVTAKMTNNNLKATGKSMFISALALNIVISIFVKLFTASGAIAGITNLFASTILGLVMYYDINKVVRQIKEKRREYEKQIKQSNQSH